MKKILSSILAILLITSTAIMSVSAVIGVYYEPNTYEPSSEAISIGQNRYFFLLPDDWKNEWSESAGAYWWDGTDACYDNGAKWPGYKINQYSSDRVIQYYTDKDGKEKYYTGTVWYIDCPIDVTTIIFTNALDGGDIAWDNFDQYRFSSAMQTVDIGTEYYDYGESDNYPEGTESFNNMIYIIDPTHTVVNSLNGKSTFAGEWYYYHGGDKWDTAIDPVYGGADGDKPGFNVDFIEPIGDTEIRFIQPDDWKNVRNMYCHIWMINDDGTVKWPSWKSKAEKMTDNGDGTWIYDLSKIGTNVIDPEKGATYCAIFAADTGMQTYNLVFDSDCLGDTAYVSGNSFENPEDSNKSCVEARWINSKLGPEKKILSTGTGVVGDTLPEGVTDAMLMAQWLSVFCLDSTRTQNVDLLLGELNVTGKEVYDEIVIITEDEDDVTKNNIRAVCADLLGVANVPSDSESFVVFCTSQATGEELKGIMNYNKETGEAEYTFTNLEATAYSFRVVDVENLVEVGNTSVGFSSSDLKNIQVVYNKNTGIITTNILDLAITLDELSDFVHRLMNEVDIGYIYRLNTQREYLAALAQAQAVIDMEKPTQEEIDTAYDNLNTAYNNREIIGWVDDYAYLLGDTDRSGDINIVDATNVQMYVARLAEPNEMICFGDVDGDLNISIKDATAIQCYCGKMTASAGQVGADSYNYYYDYIYNI